jgi:hypothetical protein
MPPPPPGVDASPEILEPLILDLLQWIGPSGRPYDEVLEAWRTSCPRLPVWEDANERGFVDRKHDPSRRAFVAVSADGAEHLRARRPGTGKQKAAEGG